MQWMATSVNIAIALKVSQYSFLMCFLIIKIQIITVLESMWYSISQKFLLFRVYLSIKSSIITTLLLIFLSITILHFFSNEILGRTPIYKTKLP